MKPITPDEAEEIRVDKIPSVLIEAVNEVIKKKWNGSAARFCSREIERQIELLTALCPVGIYDVMRHDFIPIFTAAGWHSCRITRVQLTDSAFVYDYELKRAE
jgi:hypothetical protein